MVAVRGDVLRPPHGTTPAAVYHLYYSAVGSLRFLVFRWTTVSAPFILPAWFV